MSWNPYQSAGRAESAATSPPRPTTTWAIRIAAVAAITWAAVAPIYRAPTSASAAGDLPAARTEAVQRQAVGDYAAGDGAIGDYYRARGGERTFGPAISNPFVLMDAEVQLFRNHALKVKLDGSVSTLPL